MNWIFIYILVPPSYRSMLHIKALIGQAVSEKKMFEYYGNIHVYYPWVGADEPMGSIFFQNH